MARVFIDGFESQKWLASDGGLWDVEGGSGENVYAGYVSGYCFGRPSNSGNLDKFLPAAASYYFGFHFKGAWFGHLFKIYNGTTALGTLYYNTTTGLFTAYKGDGVTALQTGSIAVNSLEWCHIQIYYLPHATAGTFQVKVNGVLDINYSGSTSPSTVDINKMSLYCQGGSTSNYWDNVVVDNAAWTGVSRIAVISPNGAGNSAQWDPSTGSNYACVDEVPHSDADFVSTNVVDEVDTYAMGNLPGEAVVVKCVQVSARARKEGASTPQNIALAVRTTGGDYFSADQALQTSFTTHSKIWETNPGTASAWTPSEVDAMEAGVKSRT